MHYIIRNMSINNGYSQRYLKTQVVTGLLQVILQAFVDEL